jgi:hypothetical protein
MLCDLPTVQQAAVCDCLSFDPFPFDQNGLASPEIDVGGRQIADALVIAQVIVVSDEGLDLSFEIARQIIVLDQDAIFQRLMPALDQLWLILGDGVNQAVDFASGATSIPSWNLTRWMTFGNWF